jgi:hypothetical protein
MMSMQPRNLPVFQTPEFQQVNAVAGEVWNVAPEGWVTKDSSLLKDPSTLALPSFDNVSQQQFFLDVFITENESVEWVATTSAPWIKLSKTRGKLSVDAGKSEIRLYANIDWSKAPKTTNFSGQIQVTGAGKKIDVAVEGKNLTLPANYKGFVENNGSVSMRASHFSSLKQQAHGNWKPLPGLGYAADALQSQIEGMNHVEPLKDTTWIKKNSTYATYEFYTFSQANAAVSIFSLPTHPLNNLYSMRYAVQVDNGPLQLVDYRTFGRSEEWKQNVLSNRAVKKIQFALLEKGAHTLKIYCVDPGVILQDILIDLGGLKKAYSAVPETKVVNVK